MISTVITYSALSSEQIIQAAETVDVKQTIDFQKATEEFEVVSIGTVNDQFNMTVTNTGDLPVQLTRLWVENTTDSTWPIAKYDLDYSIPSGGSVYNIGQNIGLAALDTQSYQMKLVSERGNTEKMFLNSVGEESLYLNLRATPTVVSTGFSSTLVLEVINTGTSKLVNLQAEMDPVAKSCTSCSYQEISAVSPVSYASLDPGDIATFEWVYKLDGTTDGDNFTFTASLVNGIDTDTANVSIKIVETAQNAGVSFETGGISSDSQIDDSILLFHMEQDQVPSSGYQMFSAEADGASTGLKIDMETKTADLGRFSVFTSNGSSNTITIPAGTWNASLALRSEALATNIPQNVDLIFHMEDGDGVDPENSEGDANRNLESCGLGLAITVGATTETFSGTEGTSHTMNLPSASAGDVIFCAVAGNPDGTGTVPNISSVAGFTETGTQDNHGAGSDGMLSAWYRVVQGGDLSPRTVTFSEDGMMASICTTYSGVDNTTPIDVSTPIFDTTEIPPTSPVITTVTDDARIVVATLVDDDRWQFDDNSVPATTTVRGTMVNNPPSNGQTLGMADLAAGTAGTKGGWDWSDTSFEVAVSFSVALRPGAGVVDEPDWRPGDGPHNSGAYLYEALKLECHQSKNDVSAANGNAIGGNDATTSLWFKTTGVDDVDSEQMLVFWEGTGTYPNSHYYKMSLGSAGDGRLLFEFDADDTGTGTTSCLSASEYDKGVWYNAIGVRDEADNSCDLYIYNLDGTLAESILDQAQVGTGNTITHDAGDKMYVGSRADTDGYFDGLIDDVMHWDSAELDSFDVADLSHTNYGDMAHQFEVNLDVTDEDGDFVSNLFSDSNVAIAFQDAKSQLDTVDAAYKMFNVTMSLPQIQVTSFQRLNFSMAFVPSTATWESPDLDMKIDDDGFTAPLLSILQIPFPDKSFPNYLRYDPDDELVLYVNNNGEDGIFFIYSGTRVSFDDGTASFASQIHYVNGTTNPFAVDVDSDSIYIPSGDKAELHYYANPTDHPCQAAGQACQDATIIPDGQYRMAAWINGYTDQGEDFGRSVVLGNIIVEDL